MKKNISCIYFFFFLSISLRAQTFDWAFGLGDTNLQQGYAIAVDLHGNVVVGGELFGSADFDPGPGIYNITSNSASDAFLAEYDANHNLLWAETIVSGGWDRVYCVTTDSAGNVYAGGIMAYGNAFIEKRDDAGNLTWHHNFHYSTSSFNVFNNCLSLAVDDSGNVYAAGFFYGTSTFNINPLVQMTTNGVNYDAYIAKLNANGDLVWAKQIGNTFADFANSISVDKAGNVYCAGHFTDTVDFNPGAGTYFLDAAFSSVWDYDIFILKLDGNGEFVWAKSFYHVGGSSGGPVQLVQDGNADLIVAGSFNNTADFDPGPGVFYMGGRGYVVRLDSAGTFIMAKKFDFASVRSVDLDKAGNIFTGGVFTIANDFDPGPGVYTLPVQGNGDAFICRLNQNGDFLSAVALSGITNEQINSISAKDTGSILTTGWFMDTTDFDPSGNSYNLYCAGVYDAFVWKLSLCNSPSQQMFLTGCDSVTGNGQPFYNTGTYLQTFINSAGCDSTLILHVTVHPGYNYMLPVQACDSFEFNGITYFTTGLYTYSFTSVFGCDSTIHLDLTINHNADTIQNVSACQQYFFAGNVLTASGTYYDSLTTTSGCDSIVILNLTLTIIDTSVTQNGITLTANASGVNYAWVDCNNNYQFISGANSQVFIPSANGYYAVIVFTSNCLDTSSCYLVTSVGMAEITGNHLFHIYPDPFTSEMSITSPVTIAEFILYEITGRRVMEKRFFMNEIFFLDYLKDGIYFYSVRDLNGTMQYGKVIKE